MSAPGLEARRSSGITWDPKSLDAGVLSYHSGFSSPGAPSGPSKAPTERKQGADRSTPLLLQQSSHHVISLFWNQTWVCSPAHHKADLPTLGHGEGRCNVYCRHQARSPGSWCSEQPNSPRAFRGRVLKLGKEGACRMGDQSARGCSEWLVVRASEVNIIYLLVLKGLGSLCWWAAHS